MSKAEKSFFISFKKPHGRITRDTLARWLRTLMGQAGINTEHFKPHSVRSAAVSKASTKHLPVAEIMAQAGWRRKSTFQKFYHKPVIQDTISFANTVLAD